MRWPEGPGRTQTARSLHVRRGGHLGASVVAFHEREPTRPVSRRRRLSDAGRLTRAGRPSAPAPHASTSGSHGGRSGIRFRFRGLFLDPEGAVQSAEGQRPPAAEDAAPRLCPQPHAAIGGQQEPRSLLRASPVPAHWPHCVPPRGRRPHLLPGPPRGPGPRQSCASRSCSSASPGWRWGVGQAPSPPTRQAPAIGHRCGPSSRGPGLRGHSACPLGHVQPRRHAAPPPPVTWRACVPVALLA